VGGEGTVWLAGHRTTYGSIFNRVPSLATGDSIVLTNDSGSFEYTVSRLVIVSESDWPTHVDINDRSVSRLILQTSHPDRTLRYLIEAFGPAPCCFRPIVADAADVPVESTTITVTPATTPVSAPIPTVSAESPRRSKFGSVRSSS
jgi:hypothetical protein